MKCIAKNFEEIGKKPIDFQSLNHIIQGYVSYLVVFWLVFLFYPIPYLIRGWVFSLSLLIGIGWEVIENIFLTNAFFRVWGVDTIQNSLSDIIFDTIGSVISCIMSLYTLTVMLVGGFVVIIVLVFFMYVGMKLTNKPENNGTK